MKFGTQYENAPSGSHIARCIGLVDLGTQQHPGFQGGEAYASRDVRITFELPLERMTGKFDPQMKGKPFGVSKTMKQSLHPKSNMRKLLEGWRGKKFSAEELAKFNPVKLLGQPCRLTLIENGDYVNIDSISSLGKQDKCPAQINPSTFFSLEPDEFSMETFNKLGQKTKEKIQQSPEWSSLNNGNDEPQHDAPDDAGGPDVDEGGPF